MATVRHNSTHATEGEARDAAAEYERQFHPCGYGTSTSVHQTSEGQWVMTATRSSSCD